VEAASPEEAADYDKYIFVIRIRIGKLIKVWNFIILKPNLQRKIFLNEYSTLISNRKKYEIY
jgi:hypothetical protein